MGLTDAISTCFSKYVTFQGRAARPEYWYWVLFIVLVSVALRIFGFTAMNAGGGGGGALHGVFALVTLLPGLAVCVRRLHDIDRSGWWILIGFIPVIGTLVLLYFLVQPGTQGQNQFGDGIAVTG